MVLLVNQTLLSPVSPTVRYSHVTKVQLVRWSRSTGELWDVSQRVGVARVSSCKLRLGQGPRRGQQPGDCTVPVLKKPGRL